MNDGRTEVHGFFSFFDIKIHVTIVRHKALSARPPFTIRDQDAHRVRYIGEQRRSPTPLGPPVHRRAGGHDHRLRTDLDGSILPQGPRPHRSHRHQRRGGVVPVRRVPGGPLRSHRGQAPGAAQGGVHARASQLPADVHPVHTQAVLVHLPALRCLRRAGHRGGPPQALVR